MKPKLSVSLAVSVVALGLSAGVGAAEGTPPTGKVRIGVYDSRAIAIVCASRDSLTPFRRPSIAGRIPTFGRLPWSRQAGGMVFIAAVLAISWSPLP